MLSHEDNEILTQVGPGTPMGQLMRHYWIPAVRSDELPLVDSPPVRLRLLGENLIAFRVTSGEIGIVVNSCPHRGASMFFGRNEEDGLRCVYHGWKFDVLGACVDMPSEPAESNFKNKVRIRAYRTRERSGVVWVYMGSRETPPPLPDLEGNMQPEGNFTVATMMMDCNWAQCIENNMDSVHAPFLHWGRVQVEDSSEEWVPDRWRGDLKYKVGQRAPRFSVRTTEFGATYCAYRPAEQDTVYCRIMNLLFPFFTQSPAGKLGAGAGVVATVPLDDTHTMQWMMAVGQRNASASSGANVMADVSVADKPSASTFLPNTSDWLGRYRLVANLANDYFIDREAQRYDRTVNGYTGINGLALQDVCVQENMGPVVDRGIEHLGTTDSMIIRFRRRFIEAARALRDQGIEPPAVDRPELYRGRTGWAIIPKNLDFWDATSDLREAFAVKLSTEVRS